MRQDQFADMRIFARFYEKKHENKISFLQKLMLKSKEIVYDKRRAETSRIMLINQAWSHYKTVLF